MSSLKKFWLFVTVFFCLIASVVAFAIWSSSKKHSIIPSNNTLTNQSKSTAKDPVELTSKKAVPSDFPAPAKKLHQVINEVKLENPIIETPTPEVETALSNSSLNEASSLDNKIEELDAQLAALNEKLKAENINVPDTPKQEPVSEINTKLNESGESLSIENSTKSRLEKIKSHMQSLPSS